MKPLDEAWNRIVEIQAQIDRERDIIAGRLDINSDERVGGTQEKLG